MKMHEARIRRKVDAVAWFLIALGVVSLVAPHAGPGFDRAAGFDLLILAIPIGLGLRTRRDGWRIAELGTAFLCVSVSAMSILLLVGSGGSTGPGRAQDVVWGTLSVLGASVAASGWVAWVLTRPRVLRLFGNA